MAEKSGDDELDKELGMGNEVGEQLVKKLDGSVVEEEDKVLDEEMVEEQGKELDEKLIMQCFLDEIPGDTD